MVDSFAAVSQLLQLRASAQEYVRIVRELRSRKLTPTQGDWPRSEDDVLIKEYGGILPLYIIARCPFCEHTLQELVDTYSLVFWQPEPLRDWSISHYSEMSTQCAHRVGSQTFVNLRGNLPVDLLPQFGKHTFSCPNGDIPFLLDDWLPDDIPSAAVIHSLPICSLEDYHFVATYQVFAVTYFSANPRVIRQRRLDNYPYPGLERGPQLDWPDSLKTHPDRKELLQWAKRRKLYWLDLEDAALPLRTGESSFPYDNIVGYEASYVYYDPPLEFPRLMFWKRQKMREDGHIMLDVAQDWHPAVKQN